jgi:hypothetical protein
MFREPFYFLAQQRCNAFRIVEASVSVECASFSAHCAARNDIYQRTRFPCEDTIQ